MEEKLMRNPYYVRAMDFIRDTNLNSLENGRHVLDGDNLFVNIVDSSMKTPQQARLEVHDRYIDVQVPLSGTEMFGVKPRKDCTMPDGEMDAENDILFYDDPFDRTISVAPGSAVTFAPDTAHAPLIGEGTIHKAIFKIRVVE